MDDINVKDIFIYYLKRLPIIIIITGLIVSLGMFYTTDVKEPLYSGKTTIILVKSEEGKDNSSVITQNDIILNQKLVATYSEIIKSRAVLTKVIDDLDLDMTANDLSKSISVSSVNNTEIIKITVSNRNPINAAIITNTLANVFKEEVIKIYNMENVTILDRAEINDIPYNINIIKESLIYAGLGIVLSIVLLFVIYYFDTSIKSTEQVESRLGVTVIGTIPMSKIKKKKKKKKRKKMGRRR